MKKQLINFILFTSVSLFSFTETTHAQENQTNTSVTEKSQKNNEVTNRLIWGAKVSPYVRKVLVTLEEKKIPYDLKEILPSKLLMATHQEIPQDFSKASPLGKIPAYVETRKNGVFNLSDSDVIVNYLEQTVAENPLRPTDADAQANAEVSWMIKYADDVIAPLTHAVLFEKVVKPKVLNQKADEAKVAEILAKSLPEVFTYLENKLSDNRQWISGTTNLSLADIAVVSHLSSLISSELNMDTLVTSSYPKLKLYVKKILDRDSFKKAMS